MKLLLRLLGILIVVVLGLAGASYLLPGSYRVERSVEIAAPAAAVFARVGDLKQWPSWTVWGERDPKMQTTFSPVTTGPGAWQKWDGPESGRGELTITASEPPGRLVYELYFPAFEMRSVGEITIVPAADNKVRVTWSDAGKLGLNPVNRWFGVVMDRMIGPDFAGGLERLKKASETVPPAP
jgi:uncharacterized protein YndB with AHSA1/START domain